MSPTVMQLLQDRVPLTLLLDLADADHVRSRTILRREPADTSWLEPVDGPVARPAVPVGD